MGLYNSYWFTNRCPLTFAAFASDFDIILSLQLVSITTVLLKKKCFKRDIFILLYMFLLCSAEGAWSLISLLRAMSFQSSWKIRLERRLAEGHFCSGQVFNLIFHFVLSCCFPLTSILCAFVIHHCRDFTSCAPGSTLHLCLFCSR